MNDSWKSYDLPEVYHLADDDGLQAFLRENPGFPIRVNALRLRRLDSMLIEFLLSAARAWRQKGLSFELTQLSRTNEEVCLCLGLRSDHLIWRVAA